jgi:hypothetical protein
MIGAILTFLDSLSFGRQLAPKIRRLYERYQYRRVMKKAETALLSDPSAQFVVSHCSDEHMLRQIYTLRQRFFAEATEMSEATLVQRYRHCPEAFLD